MKNSIIRYMALFGLVVALSSIGYSQAAKRLDLAKDGPSIVWEQSVAANGSKNFVFRLEKGQRVKIGYLEDTGKGSVDFGKFSIEEGFDNALEMDIEISKDYYLSATNPGNRTTSFRISISLEEPKKIIKPVTGSMDIGTAPNTERVQFAKGSIEVSLERNVAANDAKRFVFWAKEGQEVNFTVTPSRKNAGLMVDFFDNTVTNGELFTMEIPKTGDYTIQILNSSNSAQAFTLDLGIADADRTADTSNAGAATPMQQSGSRIEFAKGENSAMVTREIPAQGSVEFVFGAKKGQTIGYTVGYDFKDSDIQAFLTEPGLQDISKTSGPKAPQEFAVKKTGDHRLTVNNMSRKKVTITLYLDIE